MLIASIGLVIITTMFFSAAMTIGGLWAEFPYHSQRVEVLNKPKPGENLELKVSVDRIKVCPNRFYREVYDGAGRRLDSTTKTWDQPGKPKGPEQYIITIPVPRDAKPGKRARYCVGQSPKCNVLQGLVRYWTPMKCFAFTISEP